MAQPPRPQVRRLRGKADLSSWTLESLDEISDLIMSRVKRIASEAIDCAFTDEDAIAEFALNIGNINRRKNPIDPLDIEIYFPLYSDTADEYRDATTFRFNLRSLAEYAINCADDEDGDKVLAAITSAMQSLVDTMKAEVERRAAHS